MCSSILVQIRNLPVVTTYCALVCIAETFQDTLTEIFLDEGKPEDKLPRAALPLPDSAQLMKAN